MLVPRKIKKGIVYAKNNGLRKTFRRLCPNKIFNVISYCSFYSLAIKLYQKTGGDTPLVSIIMPVYNGEKYIDQAINSLINQSMKHIEIIIVDDGSNDNSLNILNTYAQKDKRISIYKQNNKYAGAARNLGLRNAKGEYVLFLDADDFFEKDLVKNSYYCAKKNKADIVIFDGDYYDCEENKYKPACFLKNGFAPKIQPFNYKDCSESLYRITSPCPWTKLFRRNFILEKNLEFQDLHNANDLFFTYSALAMAEKIVTLNQKLVYYRIGQNENIQSMKQKEPFCFYEAYKALREKLIEIGVLYEIKQSYVNAVLSTCLYNLRSTGDIFTKKMIYLKLKQEVFNVLEIDKYEKEFYYNKKDYFEMIFIKNKSFEEYMEIKTLQS